MNFPLIDQSYEAEAVILADGDFPTHEIPCALLHNAKYVCCCDGAARHYPQADAIVGDGDSVPESLRHRLIRVEEQADNDLTKATRHCMRQGYRHIVYLGASGKREDHTLGNISLLMRYKQEWGLNVLMATDHGWLIPMEGDCELETFPRQQVSIFNFGCTRLTGEGLRWQPYAYENLWQGTLNEALGNRISIHGNAYFMVFRTYGPK